MGKLDPKKAGGYLRAGKAVRDGLLSEGFQVGEVAAILVAAATYLYDVGEPETDFEGCAEWFRAAMLEVRHNLTLRNEKTN